MIYTITTFDKKKKKTPAFFHHQVLVLENTIMQLYGNVHNCLGKWPGQFFLSFLRKLLW